MCQESYVMNVQSYDKIRQQLPCRSMDCPWALAKKEVFVVTEDLKKVTIISYKVVCMVGFSSYNTHRLPKCETCLKWSKSHQVRISISTLF